jgi:pyrimidine-nucleoside phosphorylase
MSALETIKKKRDGKKLEAAEIQEFVRSCVRGDTPDYVASAFLMAVFTRGMDDEETLSLTQAMLDSGERIDPSSIEGYKIDKHSTGGVGDNVTLVLAPLISACGLKVPMISGRGLGHTGGTLDKLEAIPGFRTGLSRDEFVSLVNEVGVAIVSQSAEFVPADMKFYALRDVTGTVESVPLIASSIMSKKLAEGIDALAVDIKVGSGAFMKTDEEASGLAQTITGIGRAMGKKVTVLLTDMNQPLGNAVGNANEVEEAIEVLRGGGPSDLVEVVYLLGEEMLLLAGKETERSSARKTLEECRKSGRAMARFREMVEGQGGDVRTIDDPGLLGVARGRWPVESHEEGYVLKIDTHKIGSAFVLLGGGRSVVGGEIDRSVGFFVEKRIGNRVERGEPLITVICDDASRARGVAELLRSAYKIGSHEVEQGALLHRLMV